MGKITEKKFLDCRIEWSVNNLTYLPGEIRYALQKAFKEECNKFTVTPLPSPEPVEYDCEFCGGKHNVPFHPMPKIEIKPPEKKELPEIPTCNCCGGKQVFIRGRYPHQDNRLVCPTCCQVRLEQIEQISSSGYGKAYQNKT